MANNPDIRTQKSPLVGTRLLCLIWLIGAVYAFVCMSHWIIRPVPGGLVFNELLSNLLQGRFDISPATISGEAFSYQGRSYAYFGLFCAILRLPLLLSGHINVDMTGVSLLVAAMISLACRLFIVAAILNKAQNVHPLLRWAVLLAVVTNGESIQYLYPNIYQEVVSWSAALASLFVLLALRLVLGFVRPGAGHYALLALIAALALTCRVTAGLGLYCALGLMIGVQILRSWKLPGGLARFLRKLTPAAAILTIGLVLALGVNYARWGNPLTFVPLQYQAISNAQYPDRLPRLEQQGAMNLRRVPFSLQYYFAPVWAITNERGEFLLQSQQVELFDDVELPPSSLFLSDALLCLLAAFGLRALVARPSRLPDPVLGGAALTGLAIPAGLVLTVIGLTFRYRMEFYPAFDFAACIGLADLVWNKRPLPKFAAPLAAVLSLSSAAVALVSFLSYVLIGFGPATDFIVTRGWIGLLEDKVAGKNIYRNHRAAPDGHSARPN